jgi:predicted aspartyl protease
MMGIFRTEMQVESLARDRAAPLRDVLDDTGSEYTWAPAPVLESLGVAREKRISFSMANGDTVTRDVGFAIVRAGGTFTVDEVVFGEPGDLVLLGARSLEGLNLKVDTGRKELVAAGPVIAAPFAPVHPLC